MLHVFVSKTLNDVLSQHLVAKPKSLAEASRWYAHLVPVIGGECTLLMDGLTRYSVVFYNLTPADYARFPELFLARLQREITGVCQTEGTLAKRLMFLVKNECYPMQFSLGLNYEISADVYDASRHLQSLIETLGGLPAIGVTEFGLGVKLNQQSLASSGAFGDIATTTPLRVFAHYWADQLDQFMSNSTITSKPPKRPENVLPFPRGRKDSR